MIWEFLIVFEIISLLSATYMLIFGDWEQVIKKKAYTDYSDYIWISYILAIFLGWCVCPLFVFAVIKDIMSNIN